MTTPPGSFPDPPDPEAAPVIGQLAVDDPRVEQRGNPRFGLTVAAAGSGLVVLGALIVSLDVLSGGGDGDGGSQLPGVLLSLVVLVAANVVLDRFRQGPLTTAGVVASAHRTCRRAVWDRCGHGGFRAVGDDHLPVRRHRGIDRMKSLEA